MDDPVREAIKLIIELALGKAFDLLVEHLRAKRQQKAPKRSGKHFRG